MATLDWRLTRTEDATLVELFVTSDADERVEIESSLQPVWPPRRENRPAAGWDGSGFEGTVAAGEPLVLGYASPDDPVEPPATIVGTEPLPEDSGDSPTPDELVRALGDARPPRDAVPTPEDPPSEGEHATAGPGRPDRPPDDTHPFDDSSSGDRPPEDHASPASDSPRQGQPPEDHASPASDGPRQGQPPEDHASPASDGPRQGQPPEDHASPASDTTSNGRSGSDPGEAIDAWLEVAGRRIETARRLAAVETAEEARAAVRAAGGIDQVRTLCERLDADRARMERTQTRRAALDRQLADVDVPLSTLERLA